MTRAFSLSAFLSALLLAVVAPLPAWAHGDREIQERIGFDQKIGARLPGDLRFRDADGRPVRLGDLIDERPLVLIPAWYSCPNLCPVALDGLAQGLAAISFAAGKDFRVAAVSIDPRDGPGEARQIRSALVTRNGAGPQNWHMLTGDRPAIRRLATAIGFRYVYDEDKDQYAHPAGVVVVNPEGRVARYLFGLRPAGRDLRLALLEAGQGKIGDAVDRIVLRCHSFDPETGRYNLAVMGLLRVAGGGFALLLVTVVGTWWLRESRAAHATRGSERHGRRR